MLGSWLPRRGAMAIRTLIRAPALPSVLTPDAVGLSVGNRSGTPARYPKPDRRVKVMLPPRERGGFGARRPAAVG